MTLNPAVTTQREKCWLLLRQIQLRKMAEDCQIVQGNCTAQQVHRKAAASAVPQSDPAAEHAPLQPAEPGRHRRPREETRRAALSSFFFSPSLHTVVSRLICFHHHHHQQQHDG
ncbi:hypothetical protein Q5P01_017939 [Channa striata]|uniref:Uncharacterized protein n=1 Tax=Channa striata TaxID=64152 RepID=A0AA88M707_CHASR|nr:hypothetical protein Q5P01_017939 [Channa striata]